jgi:PAS domain S-box-containing protein
MPERFWPRERRHHFVVEPLYFQDRQLGFAVFEAGARDGDVYEMLRRGLSSALQGALLVQSVNERSAELTRQQYILDTFMESIPDRIYFKDLQSRITKANKAHATMMGFSNPVEEIGKTDFDFYPEELARARYDQEQKIIRTGQSLLSVEEPDGTGRWALTTKMPLRDEHGKIIGTFGISHDITEMKQAQAELVRQERLSALGQLTATVAHEIRNPLGTVRTSVYVINDAVGKLEMETDEARRLERALQLAERNIARCDTIIAELLDFTRVWAPQLSSTDIDEWLSGVLDEMLDQGTIPESIPCIRELNADIEVSVDTEHLRRAVINIVGNAVDAMQEEAGSRSGNRLTVHTHVVDERLEIRVRDTGCGIPDEVMDNLFEPLFSTKSFGVGLGLPIVKGIMEQHGGGVELESQIDAGTSVTLWLPIADDQ